MLETHTLLVNGESRMAGTVITRRGLPRFPVRSRRITARRLPDGRWLNDGRQACGEGRCHTAGVVATTFIRADFCSG